MNRFVVWAGLVLLLYASPGHSSTYTVTNTLDGGPGSLRQAILDANLHVGADTINFNIPGPGPFTIAPATPLDPITDRVDLNGYTQPGATQNLSTSSNNAVLQIELSGASAGAGADGLVVRASSCKIQGLAVNGFAGLGVFIEIGTNNSVVGCFIGTDITGRLALGNGQDGIRVVTPKNTVGTFVSADNNVISGNGGNGIRLAGGSATNNTVLGNFIGLDATGTNALPNQGIGLRFQSCSRNAARSNVISGNLDGGVSFDSSAYSNTLAFCRVGTSSSGLTAIGNSGKGVVLQSDAHHNLITSNTIAGNFGPGITIGGSSGTSSNVIQANRIGTFSYFPPVQFGNFGNGIEIQAGNGNQVGGPFSSDGNNIAYNTGSGVRITAGTGHSLRSNNIHDNESLGIDLGPTGVTLNDPGDIDAGPNNLQNFPILTNALSIPIEEHITIEGMLDSTPGTAFRVEFFGADVRDPTGFGQGSSIGSTTVTTDAGGHAAFSIELGETWPGYVAATATDPNGNTSEFSPAINTYGPDADGDGIPDYWEILHGLDPDNPGDGALDSDGDGVSNLGEYLAGTDPHSAASRLAFSAFVVSGSVGCALWPAQIAGAELEESSVSTGPYSPVPVPPTLIGDFWSYCASLSAGQRYYRLRLGAMYSQNTVGFRQWNVGGGNPPLAIVNPFLSTNDSIDALLPSVPDGTVVSRSGFPDDEFIPGLGWSDPAMRLPSGELFSVQSPTTFILALAGEWLQSPIIEVPPANQTVITGDHATLSVNASGSVPLFYQWRRNDVPIPGSTQNALLFSSVSAANQGSYSVVVSNAFGVAVSDPAVLTVADRLEITQQPQSQTVRAGTPVPLTVAAIGSVPMGFQWFRNGVLLTNMVLNQTTATLVLAGVPADSANYQVYVTNASQIDQGAWSAAAFVTVLTPPAILVPPVSTNAALGGNVSFCVSAIGSAPLRFQWRHTGANIPGATNSCLNITSLQLSNGGSYQVVVANAADTIISEVVQLSINLPQVPPGDLFADRVSLGTNGTGRAHGTNLFATKEVDEPDHAGKPGGHSVWYRWTAPSNGVVTFTTQGSSFDTLLAAYTGTAVGALTEVGHDEDSGGFFSSRLQFSAGVGTNYAIAIDGFGGATGDFVLSWQLDVGAAAIPRILKKPFSLSVLRGSNALFNVTSIGGVGYQWFLNGVALAGETNALLVVTNVQPQNVGSLRVRVLNGAGRAVFSDPVTLEIGPLPSVQSRDKFADLFLDPGGGSGFAPATGGGGFHSVSAGVPLQLVVNNNNSDTELSEPVACRIDGASRWLTLRVESSGICILDTIGSQIDTVLGVFVGTSYLDLTQVACDDNGAPDGIRSLVRFPAVAGTDYRVRVDGTNGVQGVIALNARLGLPPSLSLPPANNLIQPGENLVLSVAGLVPTTNGVLRYQWQLNGRDIPAATNDVLLLAAAEGVAGFYSVVIRNDFGTSTSPVANVSVNLTYLASQPVLSGGRVRLTVRRPPAQLLVLEGTGDMRSWTPLQTVPLTAPGPSIELTNAEFRFFRARPWP